MRKELVFNYPFWQWGGLGFYNCYAAVYMYLQGMYSEGIRCNAKEDKGCSNCSNCSEKLVNLFETIAGQTIARQSKKQPLRLIICYAPKVLSVKKDCQSAGLYTDLIKKL
jgi:hypothetical protein